MSPYGCLRFVYKARATALLGCAYPALVTEDVLIGRVLRELRESKGLRQEDLARDVGVSRLSVGRYEAGDRSVPANLVRPWAQALGLTPAELAAAIWGGHADAPSE